MAPVLQRLLYLPLIVALLVGVASANTPIVTTNNVNDLNADRDAFSIPEGGLFITHTATDGVNPYDFATATGTPLSIAFRVGSYTSTIPATATINNPGVVRWSFPFIGAGEYRLTAVALQPSGPVPVFDRFLAVTSGPPAAAVSVTVNASNTVEVASVSLRSFTADEINAITGSYHNLNVSSNVTVQGTLTIDGTLDVGESIVAVDTSKVALAGATMQGPLTNNAGFFGDGAGISNVAAVVATLDDVGDVDAPGVADGEILQRLGGRWTNAPLTAGAGAFAISSDENIAPTSSVGNVIGAGAKLATISGGATNEIAATALYATIGGGVENYAQTYATVAGGQDNDAIAYGAVIGGGAGNDVASGSGYFDVIGGGDANYIFSGSGSSQGRSTIGGGRQNRINNTRYATIGGGWANAITGEWSTISGGYFNSIQSNAFHASITGGRTVRVRATDGHALGGRETGVDATNAVIVGGFRQTNRVANSTLLAHHVTSFVFAPDIPNNPPGDQVLTAWVNYGASQTWYAVTQTATSIIASIP